MYLRSAVIDNDFMTRTLSRRLLAVAVAVALVLLGMSGVAAARAQRTKACHKTHSCKTGGGTPTGSGTGGTAPAIVVTVEPNPVVETGQSEVHAVIQVEANPAFANDDVTIRSTQLAQSCDEVLYLSLVLPPLPFNTFVQLDNDGNGTVLVEGTDCAPGTDLITADMEVAPYLTAVTTLQVEPPQVTPVGVTAYPGAEVETSDTHTLCCQLVQSPSDVIFTFDVETNPVYAEQPVEIDSKELDASCGLNWTWFTGNGFNEFPGAGPNTGPEPTTTLDNDGNASFDFLGASCAAGTWDVVADVMAGDHPTYTTTVTVDPPAPTI